jgi:uncharacterized protein
MKFPESEKKRIKEKYGPWAVVTGASSGIGREIAERLAEAGLNLFLSSRKLSDLESNADTWESKYAVQIRCIEGDALMQEDVRKILETTKDFPVGLLVVSAGFGTSGLFIDSLLDEELNMLKVNCETLFFLTHSFSRRFLRNGKGGIILMSSIVAFQGVPHSAHYAATKAYVQTLAEGLHIELRDQGVDVLAAAPGPVSSGFGERANLKMNMSLQPSDIGVPILKALGRTSTVFPGFLTKVLVYSLRTVPRWGKIRIMKIVMGGMTSHQKEKPAR